MKIKSIHLANLLTCGNKEAKKYWLKEVEEGRLTTLETFWKGKVLCDLLDENPDIKIFLDSGAHSLLNAQVGLINSGDVVQTEKSDGEIEFTPEDFYGRLDTNERIFFTARDNTMPHELVDYSFTESKDVRKYLDDYIKFCHKYKNQLTGYVNLDIVYNAEASWKNQQYMESNGLRPIPVFHHGEDLKWLAKYAEEYDYIGIGGMATGLRKTDFVTFANECFGVINRVSPGVKVHGFAVTAFDMMVRYAWHSVDSTSWLKHAAYGNVIIPRWTTKNDGFDFTTQPTCITVSEIALLKYSKTNVHYTKKYTTAEIDRIHSYFDQVGVKVELLMTQLLERQKVNVYYYTRFLEQIDNIELNSEATSNPFF